MSAEAQTTDKRDDVQSRTTAIVGVLMALHRMQGQELAARMGLAAPTVSQRLTGKRDWRLDDLPVLAEIFGVPMETFLREPAEVFELRVNGERS